MKIGIDGKYLNGEREIFVLGEVEERAFLGVTTNNEQKSLIEKLDLLKSAEKKVSVVNMDMDKRIKGAVLRVFPDTAIVVDKFHIISHANKIIDTCRIAVEKSEKKQFEIKRLLIMKTEVFHQIQSKEKWRYKAQKLKTLLKNNKNIKLLWDLKNKIHGFYHCKTLQTAKEAWKKIISFLEFYQGIHPEFADLRKTFKNWEKEILNYFIHRTTNAYIEGLNNRIETLKRKKCGFRNLLSFIKTLCYMFFPLSHFFLSTISSF